MTKRDLTGREMPAAFYAAAGAGDLAYQRLRKLPEAASRTIQEARQTAATLRQRATSGELRLNRDRIAADLATLRESAQRGATAVVATATAAQEKAVTGYRSLVAHGELVVSARAGGPGAEPTRALGRSVGPAAEPAAASAAELAAAVEETAEPASPPEAKHAAPRTRKSTRPSAR